MVVNDQKEENTIIHITCECKVRAEAEIEAIHLFFFVEFSRTNRRLFNQNIMKAAAAAADKK